jgi:hypothetical protein
VRAISYVGLWDVPENVSVFDSAAFPLQEALEIGLNRGRLRITRHSVNSGIPARPCEPLAIWARSGKGVEVPAGFDHACRSVPVGGYRDELVDHLMSGVTLPDGEQVGPVMAQAEVGVADGQRLLCW